MAQVYADPNANVLNPGIFRDEWDNTFSRFSGDNSVKIVNQAAEAYSSGGSSGRRKTVFNAVVLASRKHVDSESGEDYWSAYFRVPRYKGEPSAPSFIPTLENIFHPKEEQGYDQVSSWSRIHTHRRVENIPGRLLNGALKPKTIIKVSVGGDTVHFLSIAQTPPGCWENTYASAVKIAKPVYDIPPEATATSYMEPEPSKQPTTGTKTTTSKGLEIEMGESFKHAVDRSAAVTNDNGGQPADLFGIDVIILQENETYAKETTDLKSGGRNEMHKILTGKKLSVHYSVGLDGSVVQHEDPATRVTFHSGGKAKTNYGIDGRSIGIEIINRVRRCSGDDSAEVKDGQPPCKEIDNYTVFPAKFNKYGHYRNPPMVQHEAVYNLLVELEGQFPGLLLNIDLTSENFLWGNDPSVNSKTKGVMARGKFLKSYGDGLAIEYYCICRGRGLGNYVAYGHLVEALMSSSSVTSLPKAVWLNLEDLLRERGEIS